MHWTGDHQGSGDGLDIEDVRNFLDPEGNPESSIAQPSPSLHTDWAIRRKNTSGEIKEQDTEKFTNAEE
jgi:hypothetical protein